MYVVQPSLSQKCVASACLYGNYVRRVRCVIEGSRNAVSEPRVGQLMDDNVNQCPVPSEKG
jgi:hypothetical protein